MPEEHKTTLRLEIDKTIQPKQYEPIKIQLSIEESLFWKDEKDREEKIKFCSEKITKDFIKAFDHVVAEIGEKDRCIAIVNGSGKVTDKKEQVVSSSPEEEWDFS